MTEFTDEFIVERLFTKIDGIETKIDDLCDRTARVETKLEGKRESKDDRKTIMTLGVAILAVFISLYKAVFG